MTCTITSNSDSEPTMFSVAIRRARKQHTCVECRKIIYPTEHYAFSSGRWDGFFRSFKMCLPCFEIRNHFMQSFCFGKLFHDMKECSGQITLEDLEGLSLEAIEKLDQVLLGGNSMNLTSENKKHFNETLFNEAVAAWRSARDACPYRDTEESNGQGKTCTRDDNDSTMGWCDPTHCLFFDPS